MRVRSLMVYLFTVALAGAAVAGTKTSGTATCRADPASAPPVAIGDKANHAFAVSRFLCTWTKFEVAGLAMKDGVTTELDEIDGDTLSARGYHFATLANGDTTNCEFHGSGKLKDGKASSAQGTWTYTSGTGKLKGIKGKGTYKGTANADGSITFQVDGEYSLP